jgi:hypothetical protein
MEIKLDDSETLVTIGSPKGAQLVNLNFIVTLVNALHGDKWLETLAFIILS